MKLFEKLASDSDNRNRLYNFYSCDNCRKEYKKQKRQAEGSTQEHYCSAICYREHTGVGRTKLVCAHCKKEFSRPLSKIFSSKSGLYFCCREHKDIAQTYMEELSLAHYKDRNSDYRTKAINNYGAICNRCGFNNLKALQVHHKDRNRENNSLDNLEVLCANCHSIEHLGL
jgi:hypothetical protein